jgi:hypothetical protein
MVFGSSPLFFNPFELVETPGRHIRGGYMANIVRSKAAAKPKGKGQARAKTKKCEVCGTGFPIPKNKDNAPCCRGCHFLVVCTRLILAEEYSTFVGPEEHAFNPKVIDLIMKYVRMGKFRINNKELLWDAFNRRARKLDKDKSHRTVLATPNQIIFTIWFKRMERLVDREQKEQERIDELSALMNNLEGKNREHVREQLAKSMAKQLSINLDAVKPVCFPWDKNDTEELPWYLSDLIPDITL